MGDSMSTIINATTTNGVVIQPDNSGSLELQTNSGTTALTIDTSQRAAFVAGTAAAPAITTTGDTNTGIWFPAADTIAFAEGGTESMRINSSGNVMVARTSSPRVARISVASSSAVNDGIFVDGYGSGICIGASFSSASSVARVLEFNYNTTAIGAIDTSTTATSYVTSSDYRLKENIAPMTGALDIVSQLKPVTYTWKQDGSDGQGFIAHELQAVVPDAVVGEKDAVDENGNPKYQGIDTSFLVATLTAAIQELKAIVDAQAIRIETLEAK
jgi:hypothetical protein